MIKLSSLRLMSLCLTLLCTDNFLFLNFYKNKVSSIWLLTIGLLINILTWLFQESLTYVVNGFLMLISFFLCRVMIFPALYWWYATVLDISIMATITSIPTWVNLATLGLWSPQLIWFHKMLKGSLKVIKDRQKRLSKSTETDPSESNAEQISNVSAPNKKLD